MLQSTNATSVSYTEHAHRSFHLPVVFRSQQRVKIQQPQGSSDSSIFDVSAEPCVPFKRVASLDHLTTSVRKMFAQQLNVLTGQVEWTQADHGKSRQFAPSLLGMTSCMSCQSKHTVPAEPADELYQPSLASSLYLDMLTDKRRNQAYSDCIKLTVLPGALLCASLCFADHHILCCESLMQMLLHRQEGSGHRYWHRPFGDDSSTGTAHVGW